MPTNRKRTVRVPKSKVPARPSKEYLADLHVKDFMGDLTPDEAAIAKRIGFYRWNGWAQIRRRFLKGEITHGEHDRLQIIENAEAKKHRKLFCRECYSNDVHEEKADHNIPSFCVVERHCRECGYVGRETGVR